MTTYIINTTVKGLQEKERTVSVGQDGTSHVEKLGWFILLADSQEWRYLSDEKPDLKVGQGVIVRIEPR